jgi:thiol-disulfide isomerase/thioredoxin
MPELQKPLVHAPDFAPGAWINSEPLHIDALRGRVVLIDIWDFTCIHCIRILPYLAEWRRRYAERGLTIVGVHSPEFEFGKDRRQVEAAARRLGLTYPIVLDNDYETWTAYANRYWPARYLIDQHGYIRHSQFGEGGYQEFEQAIQALLRERDASMDLPQPMPPLRDEDQPGAVCHRITPELHAGFDRGALGNAEGYPTFDAVIFYEEPEHRPQGAFYAAGPWKAAPDHLAAAGEHAALSLPYQAATVNAVLSPSGDPIDLMLGMTDHGAAPLSEVAVVVTQDGRPLTALEAGDDVVFDTQGRSLVRVDAPRLYNLVKNPAFGRFELRLRPDRRGFAIYAFTFTSCVAPDSAQDGPGLLFNIP